MSVILSLYSDRIGESSVRRGAGSAAQRSPPLSGPVHTCESPLLIHRDGTMSCEVPGCAEGRNRRRPRTGPGPAPGKDEL